MITTVLTHAEHSVLTTVARLKEQLAIESSADDAVFRSLLPAASATVASYLGWSPYRSALRARFAGYGWLDVALDVAPVKALDAVALDGTAVETADQAVVISNELGAVVTRSVGWSRTARPIWTIDYTAGWLVPADDFTSAAATFAATGQTITLSAGAWPLLVPGDRVLIQSATEAANNRVVTVATRTATVLTAEAGSGLVDEAEGNLVEFIVHDLPADIERAAVLLARDGFVKRGSSAQTGQITAIKTTGVSVSYAPGSAATADVQTGIPADALALLAPYRRLP